ncbi:MAG: MBOAT family protein [Oscillospiraceae bacterium]|nr:MBOAT family protein [Oscillospiraceae bacterium]
MLFSSIPFLFYFLPAVLITYFLVPKNCKNAVLLLFSLVFYAWGEPKYVFLMIATICLFFFCGFAIAKSTTQLFRKLWLTVSVVVSLALLAVFKYADFFIESVNAVTGANLTLLRLALPIGISFYTFQCLSYTIDVYRGTAPVQKNIINFGAYVSLFPQLIAGPIVRYVDVAKELDNRTHSLEDFSLGLRRFLVGLGKKILIANQLGALTEIFRQSGEKSVVFYWMYAIAFALHIYFDFSGYSDMAIGLGRIFGFKFIENFNYPYLSKSIAEFWRRWHMSLGSWFRDYVYIPLGGNRVSRWRWVFNILVVWMLTGLWHGAAWNFVLWGLLYAVFLLLEKWVPALQKMPAILRRIYVLLVVVLGFVLFNATSLAEAVSDIGGMFGFGGVPFVNGVTWYYLRSYSILFVAALIGATPLVKTVANKVSQKTVGAVLEPVVLLLLLVLCTAYLVDGSFNPFLYFRF